MAEKQIDKEKGDNNPADDSGILGKWSEVEQLTVATISSHSKHGDLTLDSESDGTGRFKCLRSNSQWWRVM